MGLVERAKNIMVTPKTEWDVIAAEATQPKDIVVGYVLPLAAVAAIASFISSVVIGTAVPLMGRMHMPILGGIVSAIVGLVMAVIGVFVIAFIIDALAPTFGGTKSMPQAVKVAAYTYTPVWVFAIVAIIPYLGLLISLVAAVFAIYLLYLGLPRVMRAPQEKAAGYTAVVVVVAIVVGVVLGFIVSLVTIPFMAATALSTGYVPGTAATRPHFDADSTGGKLDAFAKKMEEANKKMEAAQKSGDPNKQMEAAMGALGTALSGGKGVEPVQLDVLKPMLPETFAGLPKTASRSDRSGVAGLMAAKVASDYGDGAGKRVQVEVIDTGGAAGLMGLAAWATLGANSESEDDNHIQRMHKDGKRFVREEISKKQGQNAYSLILADRFMVSAEGTGVDINALKAGVNALDLGKIESLK